jgi:hypothetical protein
VDIVKDTFFPFLKRIFKVLAPVSGNNSDQKYTFQIRPSYPAEQSGKEKYSRMPRRFIYDFKYYLFLNVKTYFREKQEMKIENLNLNYSLCIIIISASEHGARNFEKYPLYVQEILNVI